MKIEEIEIKGLFGKKDICWKLNPQVNVLVGVNGSGKSTILSLIYHILRMSIDQDKRLNLTLNTVIRFIDGELYFDKDTPFIEQVEKFIATMPDEDLVKFAKNIEELRKTAMTTDIVSQYGWLPYEKKRREEQKHLFEIRDSIDCIILEANLTNSNANHIIQKSNHEKTNALDMEIRETIYEFNKIKTNELVERLLSSLNLFFNQIGKQVNYENDDLVYIDIDLQKKLNYSHLSSGERQLIYILLRVALSNADKNKTAIILMDEPEISLHLDWQEHFIKQLTILNPDAQFIIVTHSPALIMNGWNDVYTDMEEITT